MNAKKLYLVPMNLVKRQLEPARPSRSETGDEGRDYPEQPAGLMMAAAAPSLPTYEEILRYHRKKTLWYPWAQKVAAIKHRGSFNDGYPAGGIFHFNAGRFNPVSTMDSGRKNGYLYSACGRMGEHVQSNPFNQWGYHAGKSAAKIGGRVRSGVSAFLHGVEVSSAGTVDKMSSGDFKPWFWRGEKDTISKSDVRFVKAHSGQLRGSDYFHVFTSIQEESMTRFWIFMKVNNPDVFRLEQVYGHDEVAVPFGRKTDPGGALSSYMDEYRAKLLKIYADLGVK